MNPLDCMTELAEDDALGYFCGLISSRYALVDDFCEWSESGVQLKYLVSESTLYAVSLSADLKPDHLAELLQDVTQDGQMSKLHLFIQIDFSDDLSTQLGLQCEVRGIPQEFLA